MLKIAVCIKIVPDPDHYDEIELDPVKKTLKREGIPSVINPADKHAIEAALQLKEAHGGKITVLSMGIPAIKQQLLEALAMGADEAYIVSDRKFAGADSLATSYVLSKAIEQTGPYDLIITGNESADGATSHVAAQLGEWLGVNHLSDALGIEVSKSVLHSKRKLERGIATYRMSLPAVISVHPRINEVRITNAMAILKARNKPLNTITAADLKDADEQNMGLDGSPSKNGEIFETEATKNCTMLAGSEDEIADAICSIISKELGISLGGTYNE